MDILDMALQTYILFLTLFQFSQFTTQSSTIPPPQMQSLCQWDTRESLPSFEGTGLQP